MLGLLPFTSYLKKDSTWPCWCVHLPWQFLPSKMIFSRIVCKFLADHSKKEGKMCVLTSIFENTALTSERGINNLSCKCWHYLCAFNDNKNISFYNQWRKRSSHSASLHMKACFLFSLRVSYCKVVGKSVKENLTPVICEITMKGRLGSVLLYIEICSNKSFPSLRDS